MSIRVLALDPGRTTGYALASTFATPAVGYGQEELDHVAFWEFLDRVLGEHPDCYVVCESFEFRQGKQTGVDLYPCELIGILRLHRAKYQERLYFQPASVQGKKSAYFTDQSLKDMGLYQRGLDHGRSAVKHLLHWFQFTRGIDPAFDLVDLSYIQQNGKRG